MKRQRFKPGKMFWYIHPESDCHFYDIEDAPNPDGCVELVGEALEDTEEDFERALALNFFDGQIYRSEDAKGKS